MLQRFAYLIFALMILAVVGESGARNPPESARLQIDVAPLRLPLIPEEPITLALILRDENGKVLRASDLMASHTQKIHVQAIDPTLQDYHHLHPTTKTADDTVFTTEWIPQTSGPYRLFVATTRADDGQALAGSIDLPGPFQIDESVKLIPTNTAQIEGYQFILLGADRPLPSSTTQTLTLQVTQNDQGTTTLEPILGAFAHLAGFTQDGDQIIDANPVGPPVTDDTARAGPQIPFQLTLPRPGPYPLFLHVKLAGRVITVPFIVTAQ